MVLGDIGGIRPDSNYQTICGEVRVSEQQTTETVQWIKYLECISSNKKIP